MEAVDAQHARIELLSEPQLLAYNGAIHIDPRRLTARRRATLSGAGGNRKEVDCNIGREMSEKAAAIRADSLALQQVCHLPVASLSLSLSLSLFHY